METKFKIGQEIYFMRYGEPLKGIIQGIALVYGSFEDSSFKRTSDTEKPFVVYSCGAYQIADEDKAFATKQELIDSVFAKV